MKTLKLGLVPKLIISIILGIVFGLYLPEWFNRIVVTASTLFSAYLKFIIPLMILSFITTGIAGLPTGAGKLLGITAVIAYCSTLIMGSFAYFAAIRLFPQFMTPEALDQIAGAKAGLIEPIFTLTIPPLLDTVSALVLAFVLGLSMSAMRGKELHDELYNPFAEFSTIINKALVLTVIPLLPLYICGTFIVMTVSGQTFAIMSILWKVFLAVLIMHLICITVQFIVSGLITRNNPLRLMKNQIPGYLSALGTQSSAATIPVNLRCSEADGVSPEIRNFVIPLCANIHLSGSMITITSCVTAVLMMHDMPVNLGVIIPFIITLAIAMVAAPGAPGGAIMTAVPFLPIVGIPSEGAIASLLIALYITQDSFGTACNVSGDNAIAVIIERIYQERIKKQ